MILKGIQAAGKKPVNWNKIKEINQEPMENASAFLECLRGCLRIYSITVPSFIGRKYNPEVIFHFPKHINFWK